MFMNAKVGRTQALTGHTYVSFFSREISVGRKK